jgi:glycosyltransferase involved in cell wall biosynthesis
MEKNENGRPLILLITNIPNPYRIALFNELNTLLQKNGYRFHIIFGSATYSRRKYDLQHQTIHFSYSLLGSVTFHFGNNEHTYFLYQRLMRTIVKLKPGLIIASGFNLATWKVWLLSFVMSFRYVIWSGSYPVKGRNDSLLRQWFRKMLLSRCSACIVYGRKAQGYLNQLGITSEKIFTAINTVDTAFFSQHTEQYRKQVAIKPPYHFCTIGYFSKRKDTLALLHSIKLLTDINPNFVLDIIGDGPELNNMKRYVTDNGLDRFVVFHGYKQQEELPTYLASSIGFLFQTGYDIWGLVLNEAMAAGLACLSSINAGSTHDLIEHGRNGFAVDFNQPETVVSIMDELIRNPEKARTIGREAVCTMESKASLSASAQGFLNAIHFSLKP